MSFFKVKAKLTKMPKLKKIFKSKSLAQILKPIKFGRRRRAL